MFTHTYFTLSWLMERTTEWVKVPSSSSCSWLSHRIAIEIGLNESSPAAGAGARALTMVLKPCRYMIKWVMRADLWRLIQLCLNLIWVVECVVNGNGAGRHTLPRVRYTAEAFVHVNFLRIYNIIIIIIKLLPCVCSLALMQSTSLPKSLYSFFNMVDEIPAIWIPLGSCKTRVIFFASVYLWLQ